jgi:outer membrane protein assembly factor BamB
VMAVDIQKSELLWVYQNPKRSFPFYSSPAVTENLVVIGGRDKRVHAIDRVTGEERWTFLAKSKVDASPVIVGDRVFVADTRGLMVELNLHTGKPVWYFDINGGVQASPSIAEEKLVIGSLTGTLYCFGSQPSKNISPH